MVLELLKNNIRRVFIHNKGEETIKIIDVIEMINIDVIKEIENENFGIIDLIPMVKISAES